MRNLALVLGVLLAGCTGEAFLEEGSVPTEQASADRLANVTKHGIMRPSVATLNQWKSRHKALPKAHLDSGISGYLTASANAGLATSVNLLPYLTYPQSARDQGNCGNCWVWGSTAAAEIQMGAAGIKDALSVQYFTSVFATGNDFACCGGDLVTFANWYAKKKQFVPLGNASAAYGDANTVCEAGKSAVASTKIVTNPNYAFTSLSPVAISTSGVGQATAIANIKNLLNQNQPVTYSYYLPTDPAWNDFYNFWDNQTEATLWSPDAYSGKAWNNGGGHLVTIVGYDDSASNPAQRYWIVLNSWGTSSKRPNGVFRLAQNINYDAYFTDYGTKYDSNVFEAMNINWPTASPLAIATQPQSVTVGSGQPALFKVTVSGGVTPYTYQWRKGGSVLSGATSASYTLTSASTNDQGSYDVLVKDSANHSVTSSSVTLTVTTCVPSCSGKACGSDGCGGSCGACSGSTSCSAAGQCVGGSCGHPLCSTGVKLVSGCDACVTQICARDSYCCNNSWDSVCVGEVKSVCGQSCETCTPACSGKVCGSDGCGGTCGACASGKTCDASGQCVSSCTPSCSGKECGNDGCGGSCGSCSTGTACDAAGLCASTCVPSCAGKVCGADGCGGSCGACASGESCSASGQCGAVCTPSCAGKQCGDDGCGGSCGGCGVGTCSAAGQCVASSGKLVINEVSTRGATGTDEMIELYNGTGAALDLGGYRLSYRAASTTTGTGSTLITFAAGTILPAGKHLLLGAKGGAYTGAVAADATFTAGLADSGSVWLFKGTPASLSKTDPLFVDLVGWGTAVAANYEGSGAAPSPSTAFKSVERTSPTADTDQNSADFVLRAARTPQNLASP